MKQKKESFLDKNKKKSISRVAIYIRVSTPERTSNWVSTSSQEKEILKYIEFHSDKYIINKEKHIYIDDWYSWAYEERPWLEKMMKDANNKEFDIVLAWKTDRFFRRILYLLQYVDTLWTLWIEFKATSQDFDTSNPFWKSMLSILWVIAELERDLIRDRTMAWRKEKADKWYFVWWWAVSYWYLKYDEWEWKKIKINLEEAEVIKRIFSMFVNEKKSINEIARILTSERILTTHNKRNFKDDVKDKMNIKIWAWYWTTVSNLLKNEMYIWKYYYWKRSNSNNDLLVLDCPKIIDEATFYEAQTLIEQNKVTKNNDFSHLFTWLIKCNCCWRNYIWYRTSKKTISYKCWWGRKDKVLWWEELCKNLQVSELIIIDKAWKQINKIFNNPKEILEQYYEEENESKWNIKHLLKEKTEIDKNRKIYEKWLLDMQSEYYVSNKSKKDRLEKTMLDYEEKLELFDSRINEINEKVDSFYKLKENKENFIRLIKVYNSIYKDLNDEDKKLIVKEFLEKVEINWENISIVLKFSVKPKNDKNNKDNWWKSWWKLKDSLAKVKDSLKEVAQNATAVMQSTKSDF